jgi:hypothetical protein
MCEVNREKKTTYEKVRETLRYTGYCLNRITQYFSLNKVKTRYAKVFFQTCFKTSNIVIWNELLQKIHHILLSDFSIPNVAFKLIIIIKLD